MQKQPTKAINCPSFDRRSLDGEHLLKFRNWRKLEEILPSVGLQRGSTDGPVQPLSRSEIVPCNDLCSRFEQQILFREKLAESTDPTTDRHGHNGQSRGSRSKKLRKLKFGY